MEKTLTSFLEKVERDDFVGTSTLLDDILADDQTSTFSKLLERVVEQEVTFEKFGLKIRDHIVDYLDCKGLFLALRIPSYSILQVVSEKHDPIKARYWITEYISLLNEYDDPKLNLSFIEIDSLKNSRLVVLIPSILDKRQKELEACKIRYSVSFGGTKVRYSIKEILQTHYGRKIAAASNIDLLHPVVSETDFSRLKTAFEPFGLDIERMMIEHTDEEWLRLVREDVRVLSGARFKSRELFLLHQTAIAHTLLGAEDPEIVHRALTSIAQSKTRYCNDEVVRIASDGAVRERASAIQILENTRDTSQIEVLSSMIPGSSGRLRKTLANAVSALSSAAFSSSIETPTVEVEEIKPTIPSPKVMQEYSELVDRLFESTISHIRIDAIRALATMDVPGREAHLERAMNDDDPRIRLAVLETAERLPKEQAHRIVSKALDDEDLGIANKVRSIIESRWPDDFW